MFGSAAHHSRVVGGVLLALSASVLGVTTGAPAQGEPAAGRPAAAGVRIVGRQWLTARTLQLDVSTPAFTAPTLVEVTFPLGYRTHPARRWPVTYYLAGTAHDQTAFRVAYHGETVARNFPSLVVSPDGAAGYWSDWFNQGRGGPPRYETFVTRQLIPLIDANFRTLGDRAHRAVMGESMGGFGVMMLAARHPDLFAAAASLSGVVDTNNPLAQAAVTASPALQGGTPGAIFGPRLSQEVIWRGHNPVDLAANLRGVDLQLFTGNGVFSPARGETATEASDGCAIEGGAIEPTSMDLHRRLRQLGIAHRWVPLPWGCHSVALFDTEMSRAIKRLAVVLARPRRRPSSFDYRSIEPTFRVWNWTVRADPRRATEFLGLRRASRRGVTVTGSGLTTIITPPFFAGRRRVAVTIDGRHLALTPQPSGRLLLRLPLGPPDQQQQYVAGTTTHVGKAVVDLP